MKATDHTPARLVLALAAAILLPPAACVRDHPVEPAGVTIIPSWDGGRPPCGELSAWLYDLPGSPLYRGTCSGAEITVPGLRRDSPLLVGVLCGEGVPDAPPSSYATLGQVSFRVDGARLESWKERGGWPCVSLAPAGGTREAAVPPDGRLGVEMRPCGFPVEVGIDASGLRRWGVELADVWMDAPEGEYHPFTGRFLAGAGNAPLRPSGAEKAALQTALGSLRPGTACTLRLFGPLRSSQAVVHVAVRLHSREDGVTVAGAWEFTPASAAPQETDPDGGALEAVLHLHEGPAGAAGSWTFRSKGTPINTDTI